MRSRKVILALCLTALFMLACAGVAWASDTPTWETTNRTGEHGGRIYQEFVLKVDGQKVNLDVGNVKWITVLEPGASKPKELTPNTDTTLWFNVEKPAGDYVFQVQTVSGAVYMATLNWPGITKATAASTGQEGPNEQLGAYYVEYRFTCNEEPIDLSSFHAMYQIKPDGQVFELDRNTDQTLWFKTAQLKQSDGRTIVDPDWTQVEGTHTFLVFYKSSGNGCGTWYKAEIKYPLEEKAATWQGTGSTGPHGGKVYEEYELFDGQQIDLSDANLVSITVLEPGATQPEKLTPNTDQTLWFNVQNPKGDYKFKILTKNGTEYTATLAWLGTTAAEATPTGREAYNEGLGAYYVEYKFTSNGVQVDLSSFDAMYQIKPGGQVFELQANEDKTLWFKATADQVPGTHTFLVKKGSTWYEAEIDWHLFTLTIEDTVNEDLLGAYFDGEGQPKGENKPTGLTRDKLAFLNSAEAELIAGNWYCAAVTCKKNVPGDVSELQFAITIPEDAPFDIWMYDITGNKWYQNPGVWGSNFTAGPEYYNTGVTSLVFIYAEDRTGDPAPQVSIVLKQGDKPVSNTLAATITVQLPTDKTFTLELGNNPEIPPEYPWQELEGFDPKTAEFITAPNPVLVAGNWYYAAITCKKNVPGDVSGLQFAITGLPADGDNTPFDIYMYDITGKTWYTNWPVWGSGFKAGSEYDKGVTSYIFIKANQPTEEPTEVSVVLNQNSTAVSNKLTSTITVVPKAEQAAVNLAKGWNTFSTPRLLQNATVGELFGEAYGTLITWDSEKGQWTILTTDDEIKPLQGYFVKVGQVLPVSLTFVTEPQVTPPSKALHKGWNLVAPAYRHDDCPPDVRPDVREFLASVDYNWAQLVSHPLNGDGWTYYTKNSRWEVVPLVTPFSAYWLYMEGEDELAPLGW